MNHQPMPHELAAVDGAGRGLRVRFFWQQDRYVHLVEAIGPDVLPLLASAASDGNSEWPDDPPLQQLSVESVGDLRAALAVGQAGRSHWSMSVEARPGSEPALRFDIACRCTDPPPQRLGSRYRDLGGDLGRPTAEGGRQWSLTGALAGSHVRLHVDAGIGPARLIQDDEPPTLRIAAISEAPHAASAAAVTDLRTVRWGFVATLAAPPA